MQCNTAQTYVSHDDDEDQVDARGGHAADELRVEAQLLGHEALVELGPLEEHERDDRAVDDDGHDEDDDHHYLWRDISDRTIEWPTAQASRSTRASR